MPLFSPFNRPYRILRIAIMLHAAGRLHLFLFAQIRNLQQYGLWLALLSSDRVTQDGKKIIILLSGHPLAETEGLYETRCKYILLIQGKTLSISYLLYRFIPYFPCFSFQKRYFWFFFATFTTICFGSYALVDTSRNLSGKK